MTERHLYVFIATPAVLGTLWTLLMSAATVAWRRKGIPWWLCGVLVLTSIAAMWMCLQVMMPYADDATRSPS